MGGLRDEFCMEAVVARKGNLKLCKNDLPIFHGISKPNDDA